VFLAALLPPFHHKEQPYYLVLDGSGRGRLPGRPLPPFGPAGHRARAPLRAVLEDAPAAPPAPDRDPVRPAPSAWPMRSSPRCTPPPARPPGPPFLRLIYYYTSASRSSAPPHPASSRVQYTATRVRCTPACLPARHRFPALAAVAQYRLAERRDQQFTDILDTLIAGLQAPPPPHPRRPHCALFSCQTGRRSPVTRPGLSSCLAISIYRQLASSQGSQITAADPLRRHSSTIAGLWELTVVCTMPCRAGVRLAARPDASSCPR